MKKNHLASLKSCQSKLAKLLHEMNKTVEENQEILKTNSQSEVTNYISKLQEYREMPTNFNLKIPSLKINKIVEKELSIELNEYKATLTQTSVPPLRNGESFLQTEELLEEARVIATIPTGVKPLYQVACVGTDEAWIAGMDNTIYHISKEQSTISDSVSTMCRLWPAGISLTKRGELIYSDWSSRAVYEVRNGRIEKLFTTPAGWLPDRLCCTRSGDILISLCKSDYTKQKILCYHGQKVKLEIERDEHGDPIFEEGSYSLYVAGNNNGDICVSDGNAEKVVVLDKTGGRVRFRYDATPVSSVFSPKQIATDSLSHIIVADFFQPCLHILDQNGYFLRWVDNCSLAYLTGLSVDSDGRLWVGIADSGKVKVIQYLK